MFRKIILVMFLGLACCGNLWAAQDDGFDVRVIGATFKTLAKGYVATADIEKLKAAKISRIESMKDEWFAQKYAEVYPVIKEMPLALKEKYGVTEGMSKARAVRAVRSLDKGRLYEIIDHVPDHVIAEQFREQLRRDGEEGGNLQEKISRMWGKAMAALNKGTPSNKPKPAVTR